MDGARVMNAAVAQGVPPSTILQHTNTVSVCLSKVGLQNTHENNKNLELMYVFGHMSRTNDECVDNQNKMA